MARGAVLIRRYFSMRAEDLSDEEFAGFWAEAEFLHEQEAANVRLGVLQALGDAFGRK